MKKLQVLLSLIIILGCEDTASSGDSNGLPEISSLNFIQTTPCNGYRYGAAAVSFEDEVYLIGGAHGSTYYTTIEKLDETNNQWIELSNQVIGRRYLTAEAVDDVIYIIGGQGSDGSYIEAVQAYNISSNTLTTVSSLPTARKQLNSVVYDNKIYVIGGELESSGARANVVEVYNVSSDSWSSLASMPTARECDIALINDKIYAFGGYNGSNALTNVEIYNIENDSWSTANNMPYALSSYHLASFENFVFLFGDYSERIDEVNMYNANDDSWIKLSTNFTGRRHAAVVRNNDWIYVIAGLDGINNYDIVEKCKPY